MFAFIIASETNPDLVMRKAPFRKIAFSVLWKACSVKLPAITETAFAGRRIVL